MDNAQETLHAEPVKVIAPKRPKRKKSWEELSLDNGDFEALVDAFRTLLKWQNEHKDAT